MSEDIELDSYKTKITDDFEEYYDEETTFENKLYSTKSDKTISEYDFFVKHDTNRTRNESKKKPKHKKKTKTTNLMDAICSEIESFSVPISKNVITYSSDRHPISYLENVSFAGIFFNKPMYRHDMEKGWNMETVELNHIFPNVYDNKPLLEQMPLEYVEPIMYKDWIASNTKITERNVTNFLDIVIKSIKFLHHHSFSLEKILSIKLLYYYELYKNIEKSLKYIMSDIKVNRKSKENVKRELLKIVAKKEDIRLDQTLRTYTKRLLQLKENYLKKLKKQKEIINKLTSLWADIQTAREKSGSVKTPYALRIVSNVLDNDMFKKEWKEIFRNEFEDMLDRIEYEYVEKHVAYKESKYTQNNQNIGNTKKITKPKLKIDEEEIKRVVEALVNDLITNGDIEIILEYDESFLSYKSKEKLVTFSYYLKIYIDDVFVCESEHYYGTENSISDIDFDDSLSFQIFPKNSNLSLVLHENDEAISYLNVDLGDIKKNIESSDVTAKLFVANRIIEPNPNFVGSGYNIKEIATANKVRLKSSNIFQGNLYTQCEIYLKIGWSNHLNQDSEPLKTCINIKKKIKRLMGGIEKPNIDSFRHIIRETNDKELEKDENLFNLIKKLCNTSVNISNEFPVDVTDPEYTRFRLLHLRNTGEFCDVENKQISLFASQISTEHLSCLQKNNSNKFDVQNLNKKYSEMDPIELQRLIGIQYIQKLNRNILNHVNEYLLRKTHKDVVRDFKDLTLRALISNHTNFSGLTELSNSHKQHLFNESLSKQQEIQITIYKAFNLVDRTTTVLSEDNNAENEEIVGFKFRPLRPFVKVTYRDVSAQTATGIGCFPTWNQTLKIKTKLIKPQPLCSIYVNVYDEHKVNITEEYPKETPTFQSKTMHYRCYNKWLGTVKIPLYTVLTTGTVRGTFKIIRPPIILGYENEQQSKESLEPVILGVNKLIKKETSFISLQITTNLSYLGTMGDYNQPIPNTEYDYLIKHLNRFATDYTNEFPSRNFSFTFVDSSGANKCVTQFLQPIPLPDINSFPKNPKSRSESAVSKSSGLSKSSSSKGSSEKRRSDIDKSSPLRSEDERESINSTFDSNFRSGENLLFKLMNGCVRYVALIPTYEVTESHSVTLIGLELLKVLYGSSLDHTILLASYFLHLGVKSWVITGIGVPNGQSSYVLTRYDPTSRRYLLYSDQWIRSRGMFNRNNGYEWYIFDAVSGERFEFRDTSCPLKTVDYVFDCDNIWVNVQATQDCESVTFDFSKTSDWRPVFDKSVFVMKQPSVTDSSLYGPSADVEQLRTSLETKLKAKVQKWRPHNRTIWNRYCSSLLREVLPYWEYWSLIPTQPKPGLGHKLKQLMVTYKMYGFPLNMPFVNTKSVISMVKSTAMHCTDDPNVEFGLAVELYSYPNNVVSVWVFLATISRI